MKKQNIEDIFSSMENFSSVPPPELWNNIEEKLHQPKKKKVALIWWSIAASLLIGLSIPSVLYFNSGSEISNPKNNSLQNNQVVIEGSNHDSDKNKTRSTDSNTVQETVQPIKNTNKSIVLGEEKKSTQSKPSPTTIISNQNTVNSVVSNQGEDLNTKTKSNQSLNPKEVQNSLHTDKSQSFKNKQENIAYQNDAAGLKNKKNLLDKNSGKDLNSKQNENSDLLTAKGQSFKNKQENIAYQNDAAGLKNKKNLLDKTSGKELNSKHNGNSDNLILKSTFSKNNENIAFNSNSQDINNIFNPKSTTTIIASNTIENNKNTSDTNNFKSKTEKLTTEKSIAITENKSKSDILTIEDSVQLAALQNLEKAIADSKTKKEEEKKPVLNAEKWSLEVFAGVANSENISNDKTLGNVNQSKQTNTYGVKTNYKLNKKWAVSSGLKINELGQSIANVSYFNNQKVASFLTTSDYLNHSVAVNTPQITNNSNYVFVSGNAANSLKSDNFQTGNIDQSLRYIEMPLEVSYALFNKNKTSISLNTGGFVGKLISNNVSLDGNSIGSNLDANDFVYGSLLSSTLQYRLYKKTHVFVEPGMNYYINPLSGQSFNQFQWAFNFGLNVSF